MKAKLTEEQVKELRRDYEKFSGRPGIKSLKYFKRKFGASYRCLSDAKNGKTYRWVGDNKEMFDA